MSLGSVSPRQKEPLLGLTYWLHRTHRTVSGMPLKLPLTPALLLEALCAVPVSTPASHSSRLRATPQPNIHEQPRSPATAPAVTAVGVLPGHAGRTMALCRGCDGRSSALLLMLLALVLAAGELLRRGVLAHHLGGCCAVLVDRTHNHQTHTAVHRCRSCGAAAVVGPLLSPAQCLRRRKGRRRRGFRTFVASCRRLAAPCVPPVRDWGQPARQAGLWCGVLPRPKSGSTKSAGGFACYSSCSHVTHAVSASLAEPCC